MNYHLHDVEKLVEGFPILSLKNEKSFQQLLNQIKNDGNELLYILQKYPDVRYEPLDKHYVIKQSLSALDESLLEDLLEVNSNTRDWALFLLCLNPQVKYKKYLDALDTSTIHEKNLWLFRLAQECLDNKYSINFIEIRENFEFIKVQLKEMAPARVNLRKCESLEELSKKQEIVKNAYKNEGAAYTIDLLVHLNSKHKLK